MDLHQLVTILPRPGHPEWHQEALSLFEAVRRRSDSEDEAFDIDVGGVRLTHDQIHEIERSQQYLDMLLAFEERR